MNNELAKIFDNINKIKSSNSIDTINAYIETRMKEIINSIEYHYSINEEQQLSEPSSDQKDEKKDSKKSESLYNYNLPKRRELNSLVLYDSDGSINDSHVEFFDCYENEIELDQNMGLNLDSDPFYDHFYDSEYDIYDYDTDHDGDYPREYFDDIDNDEIDSTQNLNNDNNANKESERHSLP
jgi:hypothetical protein